MDLTGQVADFVREHSLAASRGVVALSGGPDSVALAHVLVGLQRAGLLVAHLNHLLRGAESDADERFVQVFADAHGVPCRTSRVDVAGLAAQAGANLEDTARRERYRWLTEIARAESATWVATGHTADDQAETVLLRLLRGSGVQGLGGIASHRPLAEGIALVRPLLAVRRAEVLRYLQEQGLEYCDDTSNRDLRFTRNRLRHELLPHLQREYNPGVVDVLCRLSAQARSLQADLAMRAIRLLGETELPRAGAVLVFQAERLVEHDVHLVSEMFRLVWRREDWPLDEMGYEDWQRLHEVIVGARPAWDFPGRVRARRAGRVLQLKREPT